MLVPPPNGISTASASSTARTTASTPGLVGGPHDGVGQPPELAAALAHEVAQALAAPVHDAVVRVGRDVPGALERRAQRVGQVRRRGPPGPRTSGPAAPARVTSMPSASR